MKHADVGVALLSNNTSIDNAEYEQKKKEKLTEARQLSMEVNTSRMRGNNLSAQTSMINAQKKLADVLKEIEEAEQAQIVKLGDASIASPFTYKQSSIQCGKKIFLRKLK